MNLRLLQSNQTDQSYLHIKLKICYNFQPYSVVQKLERTIPMKNMALIMISQIYRYMVLYDLFLERNIVDLKQIDAPIV